jgi:hypothetical protein
LSSSANYNSTVTIDQVMTILYYNIQIVETPKSV